MLKNAILYLVLSMLLAGGLNVNQADCMTRTDAERALEIVKKGMVLRRYCAPCGDAVWTYLTVKKVKIISAGDEHALLLNGNGTDLSDLYMNINGNWVNIAILLGLDVSGVPEFLPSRFRTP